MNDDPTVVVIVYHPFTNGNIVHYCEYKYNEKKNYNYPMRIFSIISSKSLILLRILLTSIQSSSLIL